MVMWHHRSRDSRRSFPIGILWNQASITDGFRDIQWRMWRNGWHDIDTTSKQRSESFILVPLDFSFDADNSNLCSRTHRLANAFRTDDEDRRQTNATL